MLDQLAKNGFASVRGAAQEAGHQIPVPLERRHFWNTETLLRRRILWLRPRPPRFQRLARHPIAVAGHEVVPPIPLEVTAANPLADVFECIESPCLLPLLQVARNPDFFSRQGKVETAAGFVREYVRIDVAGITVLASQVDPRNHGPQILSKMQPVSARGHLDGVASIGSILKPAASSMLNVEGVVRSPMWNDFPRAD